MLFLTRYPIPRTLCGAHFLKSNLNEYILEPEEVAVEHVDETRKVGVKTKSGCEDTILGQNLPPGGGHMY